MNNASFFTASGWARGVTRKPCASSAPACLSYKGRLSRTILAAVLLAFGVLRLPAQTFTPVLEPPFTITYPSQATAYWPATNQDYIAVADFNHDGLPDVAKAYVDPNTGYLNVNVIFSAGTGNETGWGQIFMLNTTSGVAVDSISVGDVNGDGNPDFIVGWQAPGMGIGYAMLFLGDGKGGFVPQPSFSAVQNLQLADVNGDGKADLICGNALLLSNGTGKFGPCGMGQPGARPFPIPNGQVVDFDGDGKADVVGYQNGSLVLYKGDGTGEFVFNATLLPPGPPFFALADLNGDGKLDIVRAGGTIEIWLADELTTFSPAPGSPFIAGISIAGAYAPTAALMLGDFNGDGKIDIMAPSNSEPELTLLLGDGTGTFTPALQRIQLKSYPAGCWAMDGNGATDAVCLSGLPPGGFDAQGNRIASNNSLWYPKPTFLYGHKTIGVNPQSIAFTRRAGYGVTPGVTAAISPPISTSVFSATSPQAWLKLNPVADATGNVTGVTVSADAESLPAGHYIGSVLVEAASYLGTMR